jgi:hypothetical protein
MYKVEALGGLLHHNSEYPFVQLYLLDRFSLQHEGICIEGGGHHHALSDVKYSIQGQF